MLLLKIKTALSLGVINLCSVLVYRLGIAFNLNPVKKLTAVIPEGNFFKLPEKATKTDLETSRLWEQQLSYFSWYSIPNNDSPPDWHFNPFNHQRQSTPNLPWWSINDFDNKLGDIKIIWELSRFDWTIELSQKACQGDVKSLEKLNAWLGDWVNNNQPYLGANWKCGQEASIRVMHLAMSALILQQQQHSLPPLIAFIEAHLKRIAPTISYAIAQDNNHGTSEAAALFIGGSWLALNGNKNGKKWQSCGRKWLENRAQKLIEQDGSFSQYSVTYHRVMLDTFCMAEIWRRALDLERFSDKLHQAVANASNWLYQFTLIENGDAPNLGANDGARLLPLTNSDYRDFRPSVQLSFALFHELRAYQDKGVWDLGLSWLDINPPSGQAKPPESTQFDFGGYSLLRNKNALVLLNYPRFRFRPSQADALHLDFWVDGTNLLRDAGTFSYNAGNDVIDYFGGTQSHNTIQFDERDQMPRISRFLLANWLQSDTVSEVDKSEFVTCCSASYKDNSGVKHYRSIQLEDDVLKINDKISGFQQKAVLRWRLHSGNWSVRDNIISNGVYQLSIFADVPIVSIKLTEGKESRYYYQQQTIPVLEVEVNQFGSIQTEYKFN